VRSGNHRAVGPLHLVSVPGMRRPIRTCSPTARDGRTTAKRFFRFARAVAAYVERDPPDVVHLNDWHTGAVLAGLARPPRPCCRSTTGLPGHGRRVVARPDRPRAAHYEWWGGTNPLSGAIALADRIVAVSPQLRRRDRHPGGRVRSRRVRCAVRSRPGRHPQRHRHRGVGPGDRCASRRRSMCPRSDARRQPRGAARPFRLRRRRPCRSVVVTRLTHQKGIDLLTPLVPLLGPDPDAARGARLGRRRARRPPARPRRRASRLVGVRRGLRRGALAPDVRRGGPVRDAQPVRAVRAHPDAGDALRRRAGGDRRRRSRRHRASTPTCTGAGPGSSPGGRPGGPARGAVPSRSRLRDRRRRRRCRNGSCRSTGRGGCRRRNTRRLRELAVEGPGS
jgi:hypothetical protein